MKKALIIVAHGSRMESANSETIAIIEALRSKLPQYSELILAFLEFRKPDLITSIETLADKGIKEIVIFPFFLSGGSHLKDIENCITQIQKNRNDITLKKTNHLGSLNSLEDLIVKYLNDFS